MILIYNNCLLFFVCLFLFFWWIIKQDYKNKYLVTGDWSQSTHHSTHKAKELTKYFLIPLAANSFLSTAAPCLNTVQLMMTQTLLRASDWWLSWIHIWLVVRRLSGRQHSFVDWPWNIFLWSFSPFRWFKKDSCQFLVKDLFIQCTILVNRLEN